MPSAPEGAASCWSPARPRRSDELAATLPGPSAVVAGDVADTMIAGEALDAAEALGGLWGVVNNAGINPFYHPVTETPLSEWDEVLRVNLLGAAAFARAVGRFPGRGRQRAGGSSTSARSPG